MNRFSSGLDNMKAWTNRNIFTQSVDIDSQSIDMTHSQMNYTNRPEPILEEGADLVDDTEYGYGEGETSIGYQSQGYDSGPGPDRVGKDAGGAPDEEGEVDEHGEGGKMITAYQAAWNVTNAIQGMFIVGLPQAVKVGGWWAVFALIAVAYICYRTGLMLVECLYDDEGRRVRPSYKAVAEECWGRPWGGRIVLSAQLTELLMTCILYVVLGGDLLEGSFPGIDKAGWMMFTCTLLLPCAFLQDLIVVSRLSFYNAISHIIINAIILMYCITQIGRWAVGSIRISLDIRTFPTVMGVVVFGYTSHIFLPQLEGSMVDRSEYRPMLKWSHVVAAAFKVIFGLLGFVTFEEYTQDEISNSLPYQQFKVLVNLILVIKALLSYPLPYYATVQIFKQNFFMGPPKTPFTSCFAADGSMREWALSLRICLVLFTLFMALSIPYFVYLMGLVGNVTGTMLSFVWPALFHLKLKGHKLTPKEKAVNYSIIALGICCGSVGIYYSSAQLINAINQIKEYE